MKKLLSMILMGALIVSMFAGCGSSTSDTDDDKTKENTAEMNDTKDEAKEEQKEEQKEEEKVTEEKEPVELIFATNETPILTRDFWAIPSEKFMEANPNITIKNIAQPSSNVMMRDFLKTQLSIGEFPDIMVMASPKDFVVNGSLMEIAESDMQYIKDTSIGKIGGKNYIVPYKKMVGGMWYNKTLFEEKGLEIPATYDEFVATLDTLKADGVTPISMGVKDGWPQLVFASCILSADLLVDNPDWGLQRNNGETTFSSDEFVASMNKYANLVTNYANEDLASVSYAQMLELFFNGDAAMVPMGSWLLGEIERVNPDFEVGFFPIPGDENGKAVPVWVNEGLAISAETKHKEEALKFVEFFMTDKEWYGEFLKTEMLFPTTSEDVPYEMSPLRKEIGSRMTSYVEVEHWYDMTGDAALLPGLQTYFNKMTVNIALGGDVKEEVGLFDQEWQMANDNMQQ